jgi:hypothetical protein
LSWPSLSWALLPCEVNLLSTLPISYQIFDFARKELEISADNANIGLIDLLDLKEFPRHPRFIFTFWAGIPQAEHIKILELVARCPSTCVFACAGKYGESLEDTLHSLHSTEHARAENVNWQLQDSFRVQTHKSNNIFIF